MRILALVHQYVPVRCAGAETMLHSMLRALAARGHQVDVVLSRQVGAPYEVDGIKVWPHVGKRDVFDHLPGADVLMSHLENTPRTTFLGRWNEKPVVLVHHNTFPPVKRALVAAQARVDLVAVNSRWMADDLGAWFAGQGIGAPSTVIVRPVVAPSEHATTPGDRVTLVNLRVDERGAADTVTLGKGGELFRQLAEKMPRTRFLGVTGAYGTQQDMSGLSNVEVLPHLPHHEMRDKVWTRTRVLLVPSSYESWGRVGTEALCSGIPVIAHPTPGLLESLGDAGIFVDRSDVTGWSRALQTLAMPGPYKAANRRALARAAELDDLDDLDRWCDAVEKVVVRARGGRGAVPVYAGA